MQSETKVCSMCGESLPITDYHIVKGELRPRCKPCERARVRNWQQGIRQEVLAHYGTRCACCGETRDAFLSVDHIQGGGKKHREEIKTSIYYWLWKNKFPEGYRVLCHNCNQCIGFQGYCPHQIEKGELTEEAASRLSPRIKDLRTLDKTGRGKIGGNRRKSKATPKLPVKKTSDIAGYHREYAKKNRQQIRKNRRDWARRIREEVISHYGNKCRCCNELMIELLRVVPGPGKERPREECQSTIGCVERDSPMDISYIVPDATTRCLL